MRWVKCKNKSWNESQNNSLYNKYQAWYLYLAWEKLASVWRSQNPPTTIYKAQ